MSADIENDAWITGFDGIGQLISLHPLFIEEFHENYYKGEALGSQFFTTAYYKLFCDVDGALRKRNHFKDCNADYCKLLDDETKKLVEELIQNDQKNYERYVSLKPKKALLKKTELWLHLEKPLINEVIKGLDSFVVKKPDSFCYMDIIDHMKGDAKKFVLSPYSFSDRYEKTNFLVTLFNSGIKTRENRQIFNRIAYFYRG